MNAAGRLPTGAAQPDPAPQHASPHGPAPEAIAPEVTGGAALDAEDAKLVTLARGARARVGAVEGAAVRDEDGRTYAGATVVLPSLRLTAAQAAIAAAVASGAHRLEALAVVGVTGVLDPASVAAAADMGTAVTVLAGADGAVRSRTQR